MNRSFCCAVAMLWGGCAGQELDIGPSPPAPATSTSTPTAKPPNETGAVGVWPTPAQCTAGPQLPILGTWEGYMVDSGFRSGSDAVKLIITGANASVVCGSITFGTGPGPVAPTDPEKGATAGITGPGGIVDDDLNNFEGMSMTLLEGRPELPRLRFRVTKNELWKSWCELQTPYPQETRTDRWYCIPIAANGGLGYSPATGCILGPWDGGIPVDCGKAALCYPGSACACTSTSCTVDDISRSIRFDFRVDGDTMQGPGVTGDIYLTKTL